jgi:hypothetical protein
MHCKIIEMRRDGVVIPKRRLIDEPCRVGTLCILETRENALNRTLKVAKHLSTIGQFENESILFEPQVLWMNDERFVLAAFERVVRTGVQTGFVQSWLCAVVEPVK